MWNNVKTIESSDENVAKFVFEKPDAVAEAVLYKYGTYVARTVICCSTQSGCPVGCRFCGAGDSFVRSLTAQEISSQVLHLVAHTKVPPPQMNKLQIMFMAMGEPMLNWANLSGAIRTLHCAYPKAPLLISTSAPKVDYAPLRLLSRYIKTVGLQFSVHESTDEARNALVPFKQKLTLEEIAKEGLEWNSVTGRRPFFNYCVHEKNNTEADADRLLGLFPPRYWECTLSVVCERDEHVAAANERQRSLAQNFMTLMNDRSFSTRMFDPAGQDDVGGGCGQLWHVQDWMSKNRDRTKPSIGRGLPIVHCPS